MTIKMLKYIIYCGLLLNIVACASFQYVEDGTQDDNTQNKIIEESVLYSCELLSINVNTYEEIKFPLIAKGSPQKTLSPSLEILSSGKFKGFFACNSFYGNYSLKENTISFTNITSSNRSCNNEYGFIKPRRGNEIERIISQKLSMTNTISIDNKTLLLKRDSDVLMTYKIR